MKLPPVLAPWATYLGLFAPPLDAALGALVKRLDHVFGPVESAYSTDSDEPEGYDGIARRGSYERLLISEWLLAEELPDEFLRRSANNEQAFLELARKSPSGNRTIVALFDCGPNQFGSPRVVHLAMLIILARRADSCGAQLKWGILQDREETELFDGLSVSGIEKLMRTRKFTEAVAADISAWSSSLGLEWKNAWIAGGNRTMRLLTRQPVARLQIDDILEPAARAVFVRYTQPGRRQMEFNLNLPDEQHCAQLLRNPFSTTAATMRASRINLPEQDSSIIMHNGMEYFLWRSSVLSHVYALRAPRHIKGGVIKQRTYQASTNRPVIAAAIKVNAQAAILIVQHKDDMVRLEKVGGSEHRDWYNLSLPPGVAGALEKLQTPSFSTALMAPDKTDSLWTVIAGRLVAFPLGESNTSFELDRDIIAFAGRHRSVIYAKQKENGTIVYQRTKEAQTSTFQLKEEVASLHIGFGGDKGIPNIGFLAYQSEGDHSWHLVDRDSDREIELEDGDTVLGVVGRRHHKHSGALIVRNKLNSEIRLVGFDWTLALPHSGSTIEAVCAGANGIISYRTRAGELTMYFLDSEEWISYLPTGLCIRGSNSSR